MLTDNELLDNGIQEVLIDAFQLAWSDKLFDKWSPPEELENKIYPLEIFDKPFMFGLPLKIDFDDFYVEVMIELDNLNIDPIGFPDMEHWFYNKVREHLKYLEKDIENLGLNFRRFNSKSIYIGVTDLPMELDTQGIRNNWKEILNILVGISDFQNFKELEDYIYDSIEDVFETSLIDYFIIDSSLVANTLQSYHKFDYESWVVEFLEDLKI